MLHSQSPKAYRTLKETEILQLPGESTLWDYTNAIAPKQGFQPEVSIFRNDICYCFIQTSCVFIC